MRVVVDTNVFVSAALKNASLPAITVHKVVQNGILLKSAATEKQLFDVLARPYLAPLISAATQALFTQFFKAAEMVEIVEHITACRDPTDDKFLELAVNGEADFIVSGDNDLLVLNPFRGITIISPAVFLEVTAR